MSLLQVTEWINVGFFADGANAARTGAALATAEYFYSQRLDATPPCDDRTAPEEARDASVSDGRAPSPARHA